MAVMAAEACLQFHREGKLFSLEHPGNSLARRLTSWVAVALEAEPGVFATRYHACMFSPCQRRKVQILIHNCASLQGLGRVCAEARSCSRTGKPHESWHPKGVPWEGGFVRDGRREGIPSGNSVAATRRPSSRW